MKLSIASVGEIARSRAGEPETVLVEEYRARTSRYLECFTETHRSTETFFRNLERERSRQVTRFVLLDAGGELLRSDEIATKLRRWQEDAVQLLVFAVGPPDGWSNEERSRATLLLSFGRITLPHRLARVVLAEQLYRATTILAGHPYHCGH